MPQGSRMEGKYRSSYLLLQVWCAVLTVAIVILAALFVSIKPRSAEVSAAVTGEEEITPWTQEDVVTQKPSRVSPTAPAVAAFHSSVGSSPSYIQLIMGDDSWKCEWTDCKPVSPSLKLHNGSIVFKEGGLYFVYAHVTFIDDPQEEKKHVILKRDASTGKEVFVLVEGTYPKSKEGSVWVAQIFNLKKNDRVSLDIKGKFQKNRKLTFWGAYQLR